MSKLESEPIEDDAPLDQRSRPKFATLLPSAPGMVDIVRDRDSHSAFLMARAGELGAESAIEIDGKEWLPFEVSELPWDLPRVDGVRSAHQNDNPSALFGDLAAYIRAAAVLPDERWASLLAGWVLLTYRAEDVHYLPIILIHGVPERGKTRLGKALAYAAWRGFVSPGLREAVLIRWRDYHRATLCLDLEDVVRQSQRAGVEDLLLASFERGGTVARVLWPERGPGRDMRHFKAYGATLITTNVAPRSDSALATRCLPIVLPEAGGRQFGPPATPEDGRPFRERAVAWRARTLGEPLVSVDLPVYRRLGDICQPILQVIATVSPAHLSHAIALVRELASDIAARRGESVPGAVVQALLSLEGEVQGHMLPLARVCRRINESRDSGDKVSSQTLGRLIRDLGIVVVIRSHGRERFIRWDRELFDRIAQAFGQELSPVSSVSPPLFATTICQGESDESEDWPTQPKSLRGFQRVGSAFQAGPGLELDIPLPAQ